MIQIIKSTRGTNKYIHENFLYLKCRETEDKKYLKCEYFQKFKCKGRIHLIKESEVKIISAHNHPADRSKHLADQVINNIKEKSISTCLEPAQIILEVAAANSDTVKTKLPSVQLMKKVIVRKRKNEEIVSAPNDLMFDIPDELKTTINEEAFLLYDSGQSVDERIIVFASPSNIEILKTQKHWYADCTFNVVPKQFNQLLTIHCIINGYVIPLLYALLPNKRERTYLKILEVLKEKDNQLNPESVMLDFEKGWFYIFIGLFSYLNINLFYYCRIAQCISKNVSRSKNKRLFLSLAAKCLEKNSKSWIAGSISK